MLADAFFQALNVLIDDPQNGLNEADKTSVKLDLERQKNMLLASGRSVNEIFNELRENLEPETNSSVEFVPFANQDMLRRYNSSMARRSTFVLKQLPSNSPSSFD